MLSLPLATAEHQSTTAASAPPLRKCISGCVSFLERKVAALESKPKTADKFADDRQQSQGRKEHKRALTGKNPDSAALRQFASTGSKRSLLSGNLHMKQDFARRLETR